MGFAYLPNGNVIDYKEYLQHPKWAEIREKRFRFDGGRCVICHADLRGDTYQCHHMTYQRCGHEHITDLVTLCPNCHDDFHKRWQKAEYWKGQEYGHWMDFDLEHTAKLCQTYWKEDRLICKDENAPNMCHLPYIKNLINRYVEEFKVPGYPLINPQDILLFIRNKRYELWFQAEAEGKTKEEYLDSYYGKKIRGKNPIRLMAEGFFTRHKDDSYYTHYSENEDINQLMLKVKEMEDK